MAQTVSELARQLNYLNRKNERLPALLLMTDVKRLPDPSDIIPRLPANSAVIIRHFSRKKKMALINKNRLLCRKHKVKLLVSDDPHLALSHQLDGVHFSESFARRNRFLRLKPNQIATGACHSLRALQTAEAANLDAVLLSPVFATNSHPGAQTLGLMQLQRMTRTTHLATYALGGINQKNAKRLRSSGIIGFAGISGLV